MLAQKPSKLWLTLKGSRRLNEMQEEICQIFHLIRTESSPEIIRPGGAWTNGVHTCVVQLVDDKDENHGQLKVSWFNAQPYFKAEVSCGVGSKSFVHDLMTGDRYRPIKAKYVPLVRSAMETVVENAEQHLYGMRDKLEFYRSIVS